MVVEAFTAKSVFDTERSDDEALPNVVLPEKVLLSERSVVDAPVKVVTVFQ